MPDESEWAPFFDPVHVLTTMGLSDRVHDVADFGCGYGTFTIPAARIVSGIVYAFDIDRAMIDAVKARVRSTPLRNVVTVQRDLIHEGSGLASKIMDYVLLFNVLHTKHPLKLLKETYRVLNKEGYVAIMNWNIDPTTPRGPPLEIRPSADQCVDWCTTTGFDPPTQTVYDIPPHHYGLTMRKRETTR
jgi:SAM-dependent methyltransferase